MPTSSLYLSELHRQELHASGLTDETIDASGIYTENDKSVLAGILNRKKWGSRLGCGMVIPFFDASGAVVLRRIKPQFPAMRDGKPVKYLQPSGSGNRVYFPPGVHKLIADGCSELLVTEGEKKSLCASQNGFPCLGLTGVNAWCQRNTTSLIPDLSAIEWRDRTVFIVFDSDSAQNENVRTAESLLAASLQAQGAKVKVARLPAGEGGVKVGLDDFIVAQGASAFRQLLDKAGDPDPPDAEELKSDAKSHDPSTLAENIIDASKHRNGQPRLRFYRDGFYGWAGGRYVELSDAEANARFVNYLASHHFNVTNQVISNVTTHVKAQSILPSIKDPPFWIEVPDGFAHSPSELLCTSDSIIHLPTMKTYPATPSLFSVSAVGCKYLGAETPKPEKWIAFLNEIFDGDAESVHALQLWFGYCLTSDTSQQKILMMVGPTRSGKGTAARVLRELIGDRNVASPTLASFANNFGTSCLLNKPLAIISDARLSGRSDACQVLERLLSISGEDAQTIDRKHRPLVTCKLPTRIMLVSNELPRIVDSSAAIAGRMILLQTRGSWLGRENTKLTDELLEELPGILAWAIGGHYFLRERGSLLQPGSSQELLDEFRLLASPVTEFVEQRCHVGPDCQVSRADLFDAYKEWCEKQGRKFITDSAGFGRDLRAALPLLRDSRPRVNGKLERQYIGIDLKPDFE